MISAMNYFSEMNAERTPARLCGSRDRDRGGREGDEGERLRVSPFPVYASFSLLDR